MRRDAIELLQPSFRTRPETFNTIDMTLVIGKLIVRMQHPEMLRVADIYESVIAAPAIGMDHSLKRNMPANHLLQRAFTAIGHDLRIDLPVAFEDAEDNSLATGSAPPLASDSSSADSRDSSTSTSPAKGEARSHSSAIR